MFFQAEDGIRDLVRSRGLGDVYKRQRSDSYRAQRRGGKGVRGAQLRSDDVIEHFFVTTTHHWLLFFTNLGRVYRAKACLLYTSDAADERSSVDLGGRRIIKKKKEHQK